MLRSKLKNPDLKKAANFYITHMWVSIAAYRQLDSLFFHFTLTDEFNSPLYNYFLFQIIFEKMFMKIKAETFSLVWEKNCPKIVLYVHCTRKFKERNS